MEVSGQLHVPAALPLVPINYEAAWTPRPVWTTWRRDNSWFYRDSNSKHLVVQPVANRYTDYAIPAPTCCRIATEIIEQPLTTEPGITLSQTGLEGNLSRLLFIFYYFDIGGGVQTGSTRHCGHSWPIVPALGDREDGEVGGVNGFGRGNRSTRRKYAPTPFCPPQIPLARPGREPGPRRWEASD
jgi:hypothetical protein